MGLYQISLLIGSSYGDGEHESPYGHTAVAIFTENKDVPSHILSMTLADMVRLTRKNWVFPYALNGASSPRGEGILRLW